MANPDDESRVSALLLASYAVLMADAYDAGVLAAALPRMTRANPRLLGSGTFYVVDGPDASIVGCGGWTLATPGTDTSTAGVAHLRHFATHPAYTRRSVGRLVYDRCAASARLAGADRFHAYSSLTAVPFYASMGLAPVRDFDLSLGDDVKLPAKLMEGRL